MVNCNTTVEGAHWHRLGVHCLMKGMSEQRYIRAQLSRFLPVHMASLERTLSTIELMYALLGINSPFRELRSVFLRVWIYLSQVRPQAYVSGDSALCSHTFETLKTFQYSDISISPSKSQRLSQRTRSPPVQVVTNPIFGCIRIGEHSFGYVLEVFPTACCCVLRQAIIDVSVTAKALTEH